MRELVSFRRVDETQVLVEIVGARDLLPTDIARKLSTVRTRHLAMPTVLDEVTRVLGGQRGPGESMGPALLRPRDKV